MRMKGANGNSFHRGKAAFGLLYLLYFFLAQFHISLHISSEDTTKTELVKIETVHKTPDHTCNLDEILFSTFTVNFP